MCTKRRKSLRGVKKSKKRITRRVSSPIVLTSGYCISSNQDNNSNCVQSSGVRLPCNLIFDQIECHYCGTCTWIETEEQ